MRQIKFRAWDGEVIHYNTPHLSVWIRDNHKYDIMQYTGLKDKNGKEIYEGDIIRNKKGDINFIVFSNLGRFDTNGYYGGGNEWYNQINKVIGNIYEKPELLK